MELDSYRKATLDSIAVHCEARGIPEAERKAVLTALTERYGAPVEKLGVVGLKRMNQQLGPFLTEYLGGLKRRPRARTGSVPKVTRGTRGGVSIKPSGG